MFLRILRLVFILSQFTSYTLPSALDSNFAVEEETASLVTSLKEEAASPSTISHDTDGVSDLPEMSATDKWPELGEAVPLLKEAASSFAKRFLHIPEENVTSRSLFLPYFTPFLPLELGLTAANLARAALHLAHVAIFMSIGPLITATALLLFVAVAARAMGTGVGALLAGGTVTFLAVATFVAVFVMIPKVLFIFSILFGSVHVSHG